MNNSSFLFCSGFAAEPKIIRSQNKINKKRRRIIKMRLFIMRLILSKELLFLYADDTA